MTGDSELDNCLRKLAMAIMVATSGRDSIKEALKLYDQATQGLQPGTTTRAELLKSVEQSEVAVTALSMALCLAIAPQS